MVAVSPGIEPMRVPATTPNIATARFNGVNAAKKLPKSIIYTYVLLINQLTH